jgi:glutamate 5-kinase
MEGVEAVIDKDRISALLACALEADVLLMLTDGGPSSAIGVDQPRKPSAACRLSKLHHPSEHATSIDGRSLGLEKS